MQVVDGLLRIKRIRERASEHGVLRARHALDEATEALEQVAEQRRQRDEVRQAQERRMVEGLCASPVRVREIEWVRVDIDGLRQKADADLKEEEGARVHRDQTREGFREAVKARKEAARASEKFQELAERERAARAEATERAADLELEEFRVRAPDPEFALEPA